ncbi:MAG: hypothetical protein ACJ763_05680 [Bdellovibrionia bacterium]
MNRHFLLPLAASTALFAACPITTPQVWATSFVSRPLPETTQKTPTLVRGKIGSNYSDWVKTPEGGRRIYTFYELQVTEVFKGEPKPGSSIQVREIGGEKDGVGLQVAGAAQFSPGEDVVLTLGEKNPDGSYDLRGLMTGKFDIGRDQSGNEILIGATGEEMEGGVSEKSADDHHGPWTVNEFRKMVASQSGASHSEGVAQASSRAESTLATPAPSVSPSASPRASSGASSLPASQLQTNRDQGAVHYGLAAVLLIGLGGLMVGWRARKKK